MEIVSKVASIEIMSGSPSFPVGAFGQKKIGYKKAVHGSSYPEGFPIFLERKNVPVHRSRNERRQNFSIRFCPSDSVLRREKISCDCRNRKTQCVRARDFILLPKILTKLIIPTFTT
ncbi:hypothetical protein CDAR_524401 [Caerostris darwini]|uniref:Uncharacterized protein n=1 Tax=Caerostris darwini TaxID=1538125 RepID=A0AAV4VY50_9ARAC|nr:hypothetical protein CDAR_524401 [Caerostris darwini]